VRELGIFKGTTAQSAPWRRNKQREEKFERKTQAVFVKELFWIGLKGGLLDAKHVDRMGMSVWLFAYLILRQTALNQAGEGIVSYGRPLTLERISSDMKGVPKGTIRRWIARLRRERYIRTEEHSNRGLTFWIFKGKSKTKVPRIQYEVASKLTKNSRAKMSGSSNNSRAELRPEAPILRDDMHGSSPNSSLQTSDTKSVAPVGDSDEVDQHSALMPISVPG
jgi:hypothetical protein